MQITNKYNLPAVFEAAVNKFNADYQSGRRKTDFSVTEIMKEPLELALLKRYSDQITEDVSDRLWVLMGSCIHLLLETLNSIGITEKRFFKNIGGSSISGQADVFYHEGILQDYKVTSVWSYIYKKFDNYEMQLNCLAYLMMDYALVPEKMQAVLIFRDWHKSEAERKADYPKIPIQVIELKKYDMNDVKRYIETKVMAHRIAETLEIDQIPVCSDEARWMKDPVFKVKKEGRKSSLKNFDNRADAELFIKGHKDEKKLSIEESPKEYRKCESYCSVRQFCPFGVKNEQQIKESVE